MEQWNNKSHSSKKKKKNKKKTKIIAKQKDDNDAMKACPLRIFITILQVIQCGNKYSQHKDIIKGCRIRVNVRWVFGDEWMFLSLSAHKVRRRWPAVIAYLNQRHTHTHTHPLARTICRTNRGECHSNDKQFSVSNNFESALLPPRLVISDGQMEFQFFVC